MRQPTDVLTYAARDAIEERIRAAILDPVTSVKVVYNQPGGQTINGATGTITQTPVSRTVRAFRGVPVETEMPDPQRAERQYIIMVDDLCKPFASPITPARGDWITDGSEWGVDRVDEGVIGGESMYYLISVTRKNP